MVSKTKVSLHYRDINKVFKHNFKNENILDLKELKDGCFNVSYLVKMDNLKEYVLKVSPPEDLKVLTYERDMMLTEVNFHLMVQNHLRIPVPDILRYDFSKEIIPYNYYIMNKLEGMPLSLYKDVCDSKRRIIYTKLAQYLAYLHNIKGDHYGYVAMKEDFKNMSYFNSFIIMFKNIIKDAESVHVFLPISHDKIINTLNEYEWAFENVQEPVLVHYDLWDGNIFVSQMDKEPVIEGIIDFERGFYADPAADMSQIAGYIDIEENDFFLNVYNSYANSPFILGPSEKARIKLFRLYVFGIMIVESYLRDVEGSYNNQLSYAISRFIHLYNSMAVV